MGSTTLFKVVRFYACNQAAVTVARALEDIFARHGMPSVLLTDQGSNFESKVITSLCEMFGIEEADYSPSSSNRWVMRTVLWNSEIPVENESKQRKE